MKIRMILTILPVLTCTLLATGCQNKAQQGGPPNKIPPTHPSDWRPLLDEQDHEKLQQSFEASVYPLVRRHCLPCHDNIITPRFAAADPTIALQQALNFESKWPEYEGLKLFDLEQPEQSRIVYRLNKDQHNCWGSCQESAAEMVAAIEDWKARLTAGSEPTCEQALATGPRVLRLLSNSEYRNTLIDLFGAAAVEGVNLPNDLSKRYLFDNLSTERLMQVTTLKAYLEAAEITADRIVANDLLKCDPSGSDTACRESLLEAYLDALWRQPVDNETRQELRSRHQQALQRWQSMGAEDARLLALKEWLAGLLMSHNFLYRSEVGRAVDGQNTYKLTDFEIAQALSYSFWRSAPDATLRKLANEQRLSDPSVIATQIDRMLTDPRARQGLGDFVSQWTGAYKVLYKNKEGEAFALDTTMRQAMLNETIDFYLGQVRQGSGRLADLFLSTKSPGTEELAAFYGAGFNPELKEMNHDVTERRGLLGHASLLASYAYASQSSPVHRGVFVIENLLCRKFPLPPAVVVPEEDESKSNRDRFKDHSKLEACAVCHKQIDGVGFGFEHYDAIGRYRATDAGKAVDATGRVDLDGEQYEFVGAPDLSQLLASSQDLAACYVTQSYRFHSGIAETQSDDQCRIDQLQARFGEVGGNLKQLLVAYFTSDAFLYRQ